MRTMRTTTSSSLALLLLGSLGTACDYERSVGRTQPPPPPGHPQARWAQSFGGPDSDSAHRVAIAPNGDVIVTGRTTTRVEGTDARRLEAFVSRRARADGSERWTATLDEDTAEIRDVAIDHAGNVIVTGASAPSGTPTGDLILAKYDPDGALLWRRGLGAASRAAGTSLVLGDDGTVFVGGTFAGAAELADGPVANQDPPESAFLGRVGDAFIAAYAADGTPRWARAFQGPGWQLIGRLTLAPDGALLAMAISHNGAATFGDVTLDGTPGATYAALRYTPDGEHLWTRRIAPDLHSIVDTASAPRDDLVLVGHDGPFADTSAMTPSIRVLDASGHVVDTAAVPGNLLSAAAIAPNDMIVTAGRLEGPRDLGTGELTGEAYLAAYDRDGTALGSAAFSTSVPTQLQFPSELFLHGLAATADTIAVAGRLAWSADFGTGPLWDTGAWIGADGLSAQPGGGDALVVVFDWIPDPS